jgi:hypothetical protein
MFMVPQLCAVPCPRSRSLSSTSSRTFHLPQKGSEGVPGSGAQLPLERGTWTGQHSACDLLDPAHAVLLGASCRLEG